jgi:hypothetical protein
LGHAEGNANGRYGVGALLGVLPVSGGRGCGTAGGAYEGVYVINEALVGLREEVVGCYRDEEV